jgi:hypothetical protein
VRFPWTWAVLSRCHLSCKQASNDISDKLLTRQDVCLRYICVLGYVLLLSQRLYGEMKLCSFKDISKYQTKRGRREWRSSSFSNLYLPPMFAAERTFTYYRSRETEFLMLACMYQYAGRPPTCLSAWSKTEQEAVKSTFQVERSRRARGRQHVLRHTHIPSVFVSCDVSLGPAHCRSIVFVTAFDETNVRKWRCGDSFFTKSSSCSFDRAAHSLNNLLNPLHPSITPYGHPRGTCQHSECTAHTDEEIKSFSKTGERRVPNLRTDGSQSDLSSSSAQAEQIRDGKTIDVIPGLSRLEVGKASWFGDQKLLGSSSKCTVFEVVLRSQETTACPQCVRSPRRARLPARKCLHPTP